MSDGRENGRRQRQTGNVKLGDSDVSSDATNGSMVTRRRVLIVVGIVTVLLLVIAFCIFLQWNITPGQNGNMEVPFNEGNNVSSDTTANAMTNGDNVGINSMTTNDNDTNDIPTDENTASENTNGDIPDANGIHQGLPGDSIPYYENEADTDMSSIMDPSPRDDGRNVTGSSLKNGADTMDRDRLKSIVSEFIPKYFNTKGNGGTRSQALMDYLDIDYINKQKYDSSLYNDLILNDGIGGFVVPQKSEFVSMGDITIDNAQAPNAVLRVSVTYRAPAGGDDGAPVTEQERTQTVKIYFNENYKIKEVKYA